MPPSEREGSLARRLRQLEEEERLLRQSMKDVNRQLRKLERGAADAYDSKPSAWTARNAAPPEAPPQEVPREQPVPEAPPVEMAVRRPATRSNDRFANYFASGSFVKTRPLGRERRVQRNKAIFMMIFVLLVGYLVYHLVF